MRTITRTGLAAATAFAISATAPAASVTLSETQFTDSSWTTPEVAYQNVTTFDAIAQRETTGGAPPDPSDGFVKVRHDANGVSGSTAVFFYSGSGMSYNPSVQGAILSVMGSMNWKKIDIPSFPFDAGDFGTGLGFKQNGVFYVSTIFGDEMTWQSESRSLAPGGLIRLKPGFAINDPALPQADFSASGDEIQFGAISFQQNLGGGMKEGGFDNVVYEMSIVPAPTAAGGGLALMSALFVRRRRDLSAR